MGENPQGSAQVTSFQSVSSAVKRFRDNEPVQTRFRCLAGWSWVLAAVALVALVPGGSHEAAEEFGRATVYLVVSSVIGYHSLKFAGKGFALFIPAVIALLLVVGVCAWLWL
jgi:hypothetical protein